MVARAAAAPAAARTGTVATASVTATTVVAVAIADGGLSMDTYERMAQVYRGGGEILWDRALPPPELIALAAGIAPGRALDLGCGFGRACLHLAGRGWECDGVDFIPEAIEEARRRAREAGVADAARFHVAPVTALEFLAPPYDLAVDVGCLHNLRGDDTRAYAAGVARLVRPDGRFLLFVHFPDPADATDRHGLDEAAVRALFAPHFAPERVERGTTTTAGGHVRTSAWLWLRRTAA